MKNLESWKKMPPYKDLFTVLLKLYATTKLVCRLRFIDISVLKAIVGACSDKTIQTELYKLLN